jgi:hypothetical protein
VVEGRLTTERYGRGWERKEEWEVGRRYYSFKEGRRNVNRGERTKIRSKNRVLLFYGLTPLNIM